MGTLSPLFTLVRSFFLVFLPEEQKCSQNTIRSYRKSLELLFDFVKERNSVALNEITFEMMDRNTVSEFLSYLETERNCSISTRNHRLHCIRAFFKYAAQEDITVIAHLEEIQKVKRAKQPETIVEHMSEDAVQAILKQPDTYTEKGKRDAFLLLFLYKTGARVQELVDIRLCDIQLGKYPKVTIHGKGAKTRAILLVLIIYTIWGNSALMVSMVNISSDRIPSAFSNFRIAQVSDLHNAEFGESNTELIELLSEHEPDIIVITGDLIDAGHTDIEIAFDFIKQAVQIAPVYFVTGNHEANFSHYDQFKTGLEASGVTVLEDEAIQLVHNNEMITLIGLSDSDFTIKGDMFNEAPAMVNTKLNSLIDDENSYTILLSHRPELFETYVCCGVDLVLCGHAHGGQFRLPFIGGLVAPNQGLFPKYDSGLYTDGKTNMVVSRGLGNSIIPFRFNNRPEVVLVELNTE